MEENKRVWVPSPSEGFKAGRIVDIGTDSITVQPEDGKQPIIAAYDRVFPTEEYDTDVEDNCALMYLNEATLLNNVRLRYLKDNIYTYVANILIAVNPYFEIPALYSKGVIKQYNGKSLGTQPPHVFALGDKAYRDMITQKKSQSVIVSGESGAGKTESTKYLLKYLTESWGTHAGPLEHRIQETNPLLEAFGNSKTVRNNNSSRFGKFVEIHFNTKNFICGAFISHYLLEKSRICGQSPGERNYHIFYQLCAGAPQQLYDHLALGPPDQYRYLNKGCTQFFTQKATVSQLPKGRCSKEMTGYGSLNDIKLDDRADFQKTCDALTNMGVSAKEQEKIFCIVGGVLHLGNVMFEEDPDDNKGGCSVKKSSEPSLAHSSRLLGLNQSDLRISLTSRMMQAVRAGQKGTAIMKPLKPGEAQAARDALAKALYCRLFDHLVTRINGSLPFSSSQNFIGILDIAGFEYFQHNDYEQFCINYCNEKLQQFFNQRILKEEQILYEKEGLNVKKIHYVDNADCIELIEKKGTGILDLLDEENRLPRPVPTHFTAEVHNKNKNHYRLLLPRKSKLKAHRDIRDEEGFLIRHFAGAVCYQSAQFLDKNNDALHASLLFMVVDSKEPLVGALFKEEAEKVRGAKTGKLSFVSVGSKFRSQLGVLLDKLQSTGTCFIRCIKPNSRMVAHDFEGANILAQLQCAGMHSVLDLMQQGYPSRTMFAELYKLYKDYLPPALARLDPRLFCKSLFKALGLDDVDFKFGLTKVFFKPGKFAEFDQLLKSDPEHLAELVAKVKKWLICTRFKKAIYGAWEVIKLKNKIKYRRENIIRIQKTVRMFLAVQRFRPRYKGIQLIRALLVELNSMGTVVGKLKKERAPAEQRVQKLAAAIDLLINRIKIEPMKRAEIEREHQRLVSEMNGQLGALKKMLEQQKNAEEEERLRRIQEEMEKERKRKEEEERVRREEEERKRQKALLEVKRKKEEEEKKRQEEEDRRHKDLLESERKRESEETERKKQILEQERRDRELALRLAAEDQSQVDDVSIPSNRASAISLQSQQSKHDLSKLSYAELRDTINTSCDVDLLEVCKEEFHRRLKVYQAWKQKNKKKGETQSEQHAPDSVVHAGEESEGHTLKAGDLSAQQFFRIPFVRPSDQGSTDKKQGWWYAHFDGRWISRQMELHPDKVPVLLVAGVDDMQMCELSLESTGLTTKVGAPILMEDFEKAWHIHGGNAYLSTVKSRVSSKYLQTKLANRR